MNPIELVDVVAPARARRRLALPSPRTVLVVRLVVAVVALTLVLTAVPAAIRGSGLPEALGRLVAAAPVDPRLERVPVHEALLEQILGELRRQGDEQAKISAAVARLEAERDLKQSYGVGYVLPLLLFTLQAVGGLVWQIWSGRRREKDDG